MKKKARVRPKFPKTYRKLIEMAGKMQACRPVMDRMRKYQLKPNDTEHLYYRRWIIDRQWKKKGMYSCGSMFCGTCRTFKANGTDLVKAYNNYVRRFKDGDKWLIPMENTNA